MQMSPTQTAPITPLSLAVDNTVDPVVVTAPPLAELANCWPIIEPILKRATDRIAGYEPIDLLQRVMLGQMAMFVVREQGRIAAVAVTEVKVFPRSRVLEVPFIAGRGLKRWWKPLLDVLDAQAKALGCSCLMGFDRPGWSKFGFKVGGVILVRELGP
jgi:hypothetical protein